MIQLSPVEQNSSNVLTAHATYSCTYVNMFEALTNLLVSLHTSVSCLLYLNGPISQADV